LLGKSKTGKGTTSVVPQKLALNCGFSR